jgi:hypothetical protein
MFTINYCRLNLRSVEVKKIETTRKIKMTTEYKTFLLYNLFFDFV